MRIVSWNLHGATIPGRATNAMQHRAWEHMRDRLGADLVLAQEVSKGGVPPWLAEEGWTVLAGIFGTHRKAWYWGSVIAARPGLRLVARPELFSDRWLAHLYDLVLLGQVQLGDVTLLVSSVHSAAMPVRKWLEQSRPALPLTEEEMAGLQRPGSQEEPYINDFAFTALERTFRGGRFIASGDWNTCRKYPGGPEFFARARERGWVECHPEPEEQSYFSRGGANEYQLDHAFCDATTARSLGSCRVVVDEVTRQVSDHAPLLIDFPGL
ncbi:MAG: hypothetical protein GXY76_19460 [Chloroflexi bacterium]|nr:hypothetical protein [Chloroflexota bacterium]